MAKKKNTIKKTYAKIDETLAGGFLPGGAKPAGAPDPRTLVPPMTAQTTMPPVVNTPDVINNDQSEVVKKPSEVYRDDKGNLSGIEIDGKTYLGLSPSEVRKMQAAQMAKQATPAGAVEVGAARAAEQQQAQSQAALQQLGLTPQQMASIQAGATEAPINWGQAITAGLANVAPSTIGGAAGGAAIGAVGGAGVGAAPGAVIGGIGGFLTGFFNGIRSNIKAQQSGEIASTTKVLTNAKSNLRQIRMLAQSDPSRADEAVELYNMQMAEVYAAHQKLKLETQGNLNAFMEDGTEKLAEFELFLMPGGYADLQRMRLEEALISGVPATPEQLLLSLQQDQMEDLDE